MTENHQTIKEEIKKILRTPGKVRGVVLQTDAGYVREKKGEAGFLAVKKELEEMGCPIKYEKIKATSWYSVGFRVISLLAIRKVFNLGDKDIEEMGNIAPKYSFVVGMLMKYFITFQMTYEQSPAYWVKHYTVGKLEAPDYSLKKKYYTIRLRGFKVHPILCTYLGGYFVRMGQFVLKGSNFKVKETKCMFSGDPYHEFLISWE